MIFSHWKNSKTSVFDIKNWQKFASFWWLVRNCTQDLYFRYKTTKYIQSLHFTIHYIVGYFQKYNYWFRKLFLRSKKSFTNSRSLVSIFLKSFNSFKLWNMRAIFETEYFFNLFLEASIRFDTWTNWNANWNK